MHQREPVRGEDGMKKKRGGEGGRGKEGWIECAAISIGE